MPVFHTKTIESILEPVAQQVSRLIILHEEAEDGNAMPDLSRPVQAVKLAVDNLVQIGYQTTNTSTDAQMKQDMPPALERVERSADWLLEASQLLAADPFSALGRKKLIEGARGILQGTSSLLLAFDESEVRKIIAQCKAVNEYLSITEVIDNLTDLVTFVKNISPGLTQMSKQVDEREKDLTHQAHRTILQHCLQGVRDLTPVLISSIKVYITTNSSQSPATEDARENRNFTVKSMCGHIQEIIRVLQLTSVDSDDFAVDDAAAMRNFLMDMQARRQAAHDWLSDPTSEPGGIGEQAVTDMVSAALAAAERCPDPEIKKQVEKAVSDIKSMVAALNELKANGQGDTTQAHALARSIEHKLDELQSIIAAGAEATEKAGARATARTLRGRIDEARAWLNSGNPQNGRPNGEAAARKVIADSRRIAMGLPPGQIREELLALCDEAEQQLDQLCQHCNQGTANSPQAKALAQMLSHRLGEIEGAVNRAICDKVVDAFLDVNGPIKALSAAALAPLDTPNREQNYLEKAEAFDEHSSDLAQTAVMVAYNSATQNKATLDDITSTSKQVTQLAPQVVRAGRVVLVNPSDDSTKEHFDIVKKQWTDNSEKLRILVDENTDSLAFIRATEAAILKDTASIESSIVGEDPQGVVDNAANIARRTNRLIQLAQQEVDNSEDAAFRQDITAASEKLKTTMPQMVRSAKALTMNPRDEALAQAWRSKNDELLDCVRDMRMAVEAGQAEPMPPPLSPRPPPIPDVSSLSLAEEAPPRPPLPAELTPPPRPPTPTQDEELERVFQHQPQDNQPIMMAAHDLHQEVKHWESSDNELIQAAKQMALLMAKLSELVRGERGSKKELIDTAKAIAEASDVVTRLAKGLAAECTDKRVRTNLLQVCERIPTIGTQLKILSTVKATMLGAQGSQEDEEATEMLVGNAQNLMHAVRDAVHAAEGASIKIRVQSGYSIRWVRRRPWYT